MLDLLIYSVKSIFANKVRSFLTMLGIIVGITSMLIISVIGRAFNDTFASVTERLYKADRMTMTIVPSDENKTYATYEDGTVIVPETVNLDIRKINELLESKEYSGAYVSTGNFIDYTSKGMYNSRIDNTIIWSAYGNELSNNDDFLLKGRDISLSDNKECAATVVISDVTERNLFGDEEDSIGKTILIQVDNSVIPAIVVGVYMDLSYSIYNAGILYLNHSYIETKYSNLLNNQYWQRQEFTITMEDIDNKELFKQKAVTDINNILNDSQWQLNAITDTESLESTRNLVSIILDIVFAIACISLFIGSIGIMSIMIIINISKIK